MKPFLWGNKMSNVIDITGNKYGRLTVLHLTEVRKRKAHWLCKCDCGNIKEVIGASLKNKNTQSCGCFHSDQVRKSQTTHGDSKGRNNSRLFKIWGNMKTRCNNKNNKSYIDYGGRGIAICKEWDDYSTFKHWALINNYSENLQIDRIDNNKGYFPDNCRWVTRNINVRNVRSSKGSSSKYVGVHFSTAKNKWQASIGFNGTVISIGCFCTELEAATARDAYVKENKLEGFTINLP